MDASKEGIKSNISVSNKYSSYGVTVPSIDFPNMLREEAKKEVGSASSDGKWNTNQALCIAVRRNQMCMWGGNVIRQEQENIVKCIMNLKSQEILVTRNSVDGRKESPRIYF